MTVYFKNYPKCSFFFVISSFFVACNHADDVDVSEIDLNLKIERFDKDLATIKPGEVKQKLPQLREKYGVFYRDYFEKVLNVGSTETPSYQETVSEILAGKPYRDLQNATNSVFPDMEKWKPTIEDAFKHIKYYYPEQKIPRLITYISGFQLQTSIGKDYIGVGLDMFLGNNSPFYPALVESVPMYISRRFTPANLTPRIVEIFTREELFPEPESATSLLAKMIHEGKVMYFMKKIQPSVADSILIGYTSAQMTWARNYESDVWAYFLEQNLLYETDYLKIQKYLSEAPFTPGLGSNNDSAPKLAIFTGWQIVNQYMENEKDVTLQELMSEQNEQKILRQSKYRPILKDDNE